MGEDNLIIQMENVFFSYPYSEAPVLDRLNFKLKKGDKLGLIGHNGSGKTTFMHLIMGLLMPSSGTIRIYGKPVKTEKDFRIVREKIGLLFQHADDQLFSPTVLEDVAFGPLNLGKTPDQAREISIQTLEKLNLQGFKNRITHKLSGGEKKLVSLATVLVMQPEVLLLDEPTTGLDEATKERIIRILNSLDISYIIVSHEYDFLARTTNQISNMEKGQIFHNGNLTLHKHYHRHKMGKVPHKHEE
ncbi:ABC transporter ATP-binding protein [Desulfococcaceae bacterium HSG8]|nr:ABC transporter ATP-binding protein [Desulfococcaceae bacterium HSG8]